VHGDALGSTRLVTDPSAAVAASYDYQSYGAQLDHAGNAASSYLFTGQQLDQESGLYYLRARYYDAANARFLGRDPATGEMDGPLTQNKYLYANANPENLTDPTGRDPDYELLIARRVKAQLGLIPGCQDPVGRRDCVHNPTGDTELSR